MSLLAYAVAESEAAAIDGEGLDGESLSTIRSGRVAMVVSHHASRPEPTPEALWRYEEIVERLMARQSILPARFGSVLADEEDAREALRTRHDELWQALAQIRGAVELGIRGNWTSQPEQPSAHSGTDYMLGRLEIHRRAERAASQLEPLRSLARTSKMKVLPSPSIPFAGAYLVDRERTDGFFELARELGESLEDADLVCTGPWPPYSFAQASALDRDLSGAAR